MTGWAFLTNVELASMLTADPLHAGLRDELVRRVTHAESVLVSPRGSILAQANCRSCGFTERRTFDIKGLKA